MRITTILLFFFSLTIESIAQVAEVYQNPIERSQEVIKNLASEEKFEGAESIISETLHYELQLLRKGRISKSTDYIEYPEKVLQRILDSSDVIIKPELYIFNSSGIQAYSTALGSIYISLGLVENLSCEEELAFVIAHELSHITEQHVLQKAKKGEELKEQDGDGVAGRYLQLQYSKEHESEADILALDLIIASGYNAHSAINALNRLRLDSSDYKNLDFEKLVTDWESGIDTAEIVEGLSEESDDDDSFVNDDRFMTHPASEKRITLMKELLASRELGIKSNVDSTDFNNYRNYISNELYKYAMIEVDVGRGFFKLMEKAVDSTISLEEQEILLGYLYFIGVYKSVDAEEKILTNNSDVNLGVNYNYFIQKWLALSANKATAFSFQYVTNLVKNNPNNESFVFWRGMMAEQYFGKSGAASFYKAYLENFPEGQYALIVKQHLND